jgi:hypothetical protein
MAELLLWVHHQMLLVVVAVGDLAAVVAEPQEVMRQ